MKFMFHVEHKFSKFNIYTSKILSSVIVATTTIVVSLICLFICLYSKEFISILKKFLNLTAIIYDTSVTSLLSVVALLILIELIYILIIGDTGIILGHKKYTNKILYSFIYGFLMYIITAIIMLLVIYVLGLFDSNIMNLIKTNDVININSIKLLIYFVITLYLIFTIIIYSIGLKSLQKGVNVE